VFSLATMRRIPLASAGNSNVALSDSTSAITSSSFTKSPSFFNQVEMVTSVIDSPTAGTFISLIAPVVCIGFVAGVDDVAAVVVAVGFGDGEDATAPAPSAISQM